MRIKLFENFNQFYREIGFDEFFQSTVRSFDAITKSEDMWIDNNFSDCKEVLYFSDNRDGADRKLEHYIEKPDSPIYGYYIENYEEASIIDRDYSLSIEKYEDEYFRVCLSTFSERSGYREVNNRYFICDQFDGLKRLIMDLKSSGVVW